MLWPGINSCFRRWLWKSQRVFFVRMSNDGPLLSPDYRITLRDGHSMPLFGLGCYSIKQEETKNAVSTALKCGYRLIDTAHLYDNERQVGEALKESCLPRSEYFIVTKLDTHSHGYAGTKKSLKQSIEKLDLDFVDLFLIHSPSSGSIIDTWKAMVDLKSEGLPRSIGVSNFNTQHLEPLIASGMDIPCVNQFEFHPWHQQPSAYEFCRKNGIAVMGFCPLARCKKFEDGLYPVIDTLSQKYCKTKQQILLRWALQRKVVTIPRSSKSSHIEQNINLYDFELSADEMDEITALEEAKKVSAVNAMSQAWTG